MVEDSSDRRSETSRSMTERVEQKENKKRKRKEELFGLSSRCNMVGAEE
jgi:hypothetical protein